MYSSISKLDRDIARSFLHAPTNTISYRPVQMRNEHNHRTIIPYSSIDYKESLGDDLVPQPHPNAQLGYPINTNIIPMYYDVIIDTVTDYDIFYPIAKQTKKYYSSLSNDQQSIPDDPPIYPRYHVERFDEHVVSMNFPHDYDSIPTWSNHTVQNEQLQPIKNVRFNDTPTWIPYSNKTIEKTSIPMDQYYFYPETITPIDNQQPPPARYITAPFFWFRPVLDQNYAICIPTSRPSLHAYITSSFDPTTPAECATYSTPNPIRL